jgi:LytS/YehU family sensor histidine kinase
VQIRIGQRHGTVGGVDARNAVLWQAFIGVLMYGILAGGISAAKAWIFSRELAVGTERAERLRAQAELASLRAHLEPHFLFNTLHSVVALMRSDLALAERALEELSALLGYVLHLDRTGVQLVSIEEEWRLTERYLWLERLRMAQRLAVVADLDDDVLDVAIPPFTIQPLVENAIRHGLSPKRAGGTLRIRARTDSGLVVLEVEDDGVGCVTHSARGAGLGTRAVAQRLTGQFGESAQMSIDSAPGRGYRVRLTFPLSAIDGRPLEVAHAAP